MALLNLSDSATESGPVGSGLSRKKLGQYDIPYLLAGNAQKVLILGAGGGNDAAGALRHDVAEIDAVEIDPGIYRLGTRFHPESPYSDSRVNVVVEDARSFLKKSTEKYDVISFGLLDAHTLASSYNNMRIDHYVYTKQAFEEARGLLREDGLLTVVFEVQRAWIAQRLHCLLEEVFGEAPVAFKIRRGRLGWGGTMFVIGARQGAAEDAIRSDPALASFVFLNRVDYSRRDSTAAPVKLTTDDWPYLYLEEAGIPKLHLSIMVILLLILVAASKILPSRGQKMNLHFFFLGAAFLLLEFQNVSKSTMLFGSTWQVNSFIISAILILILLANLFVSKFKPDNMKTIYILLSLSLLVSYFIPLSLFNVLGYWPKSIAASIVLNLPIFFAGVIFIDSFRKTRHKDLAFGSNLLGAAAGGLMESLSFIVGINMLLLVALGFYGLSWMFLNRSD